MRTAVVIGGGVAGLAAAGALTAAGTRVVLLEARARLGGRILTVRDPGSPVPVELGAEFVEVPGAAWEALRAAGGASYRSEGGMWEVVDGEARPLDLEATVGRVLGRLRPPPAEDLPFVDWLAGERGLDERDRTWALRFVEGFHAARVDRVGVHWLAKAAEGEGGGGGEVRHHPLGGLDRAVVGLRTELGPRCRVVPRAVVTEVRWHRGAVAVRWRGPHGPGEPVHADLAVVAVPLAVLRAGAGEEGAIRFDPPLPAKAEAAAALEVGRVVKVVFRFRRHLWEQVLRFRPDERPRERKFLLGGGAVPTWWTPSPVRVPQLTAWAGGGAADRLLAAGDPVEGALDDLAAILRLPRRRVDAEVAAVHLHDWDADPFARGAYSYVPAGALGAPGVLGAPVEGTLFFAGEATATDGWNATVDGAIRSGRRAAAEALGRAR